MNYKLIKSVVATPIERIRGDELITVAVNCTFINPQQVTREVVGIGTCTKSSELSVAVLNAVENAKSNMKALFEQDSEQESKSNPALTRVVKQLMEPAVNTKLKNVASRSEYDKMVELATEDRQEKISGLCEALGIDIIDVVAGAYSNVEVLVLGTYLEKLTEPLQRGV